MKIPYIVVSSLLVAVAASSYARDITGLEVVCTPSNTVALVNFTAGQAGDSHVVYFAWDEDGTDHGATLGDWPNVMRAGRVGDSDTCFTLSSGIVIPADTACRAFLATTDTAYDYLVSYIRATGAQYVNTGFCATPTTAVAMDFKLANYKNTSIYLQQNIFSCSAASSVSGVLSFSAYINGAGCWAYSCNNSVGAWVSSGITTLNNVRTQILLDAAGGQYVICTNGVLQINKAVTQTRTNTSQLPLHLFTRFTPESATTGTLISTNPRCDLYCYSCSITNAGVCVRDYLPAVKGGIAGLYDSVNDTFTMSGNTVSLHEGARFSAGTNITFRVIEGDVQVAASPAASAIVSAARLTWNVAVKNGAFNDAANWGDGTGGFPTIGDTVVFTQGTYTITSDGNRAVTGLYGTGNGSKQPLTYPTLDLGGHFFRVFGSYNAESTWGRPKLGVGLTVTNGTFEASSLLIGKTAENMAGSGEFHAANADVRIAGDVTIRGAMTGLTVSDGASFSCQRITTYASLPQTEGGRRYVSTIDIRGEGTKAYFNNGLKTWSYTKTLVRDGAHLVLSGFTDIQVSNGERFNIIGRNSGSTTGNFGELTIDNASMTVNEFALAIGYSESSGENCAPQTGSTLTLTNNAVMTFNSVPTLFLGYAQSATANFLFVTNDALNVVGGSTLYAPSTAIEASRKYRSSFSKVNVDDGTITAKTLAFGNYSQYGCGSNALFSVAGKTAKVSVLNTSASALTLRMGTKVRFTIPKDGFDSVPVTVAGALTNYTDEVSYAVDPVSLEIDADAFGRRHGAESVTLIECGKASRLSLQRLVDNFSFINTSERRRGTVAVSDDGKSLVYTSPEKLGMMLFVE